MDRTSKISKILDAAEEIMSEKGLRDSSIAEIAKKAAVTFNTTERANPTAMGSAPGWVIMFASKNAVMRMLCPEIAMTVEAFESETFVNSKFKV